MATIKGNNKKNKLVGTNSSETLLGLGDNDKLYGKGGNDTLKGGSGDDQLNGDAGNDKLFGEAGNDRLSGGTVIDSSTGTSGNGAFKIIGGAFTTKGGEIKISVTSGGNTLIEINNDTDKSADMSILVMGTPTLTAADFIL